MRVHSATNPWGWTLPQRGTNPAHYELSIKSPEVRHSLVFLGDPEDLLDPLDPVEHTACYTLENNLSQVTFTLKNGLIVTTSISTVWKVFTQKTGGVKHKHMLNEIFKVQKPQEYNFISSWKYGLGCFLQPHSLWNHNNQMVLSSPMKKNVVTKKRWWE